MKIIRTLALSLSLLCPLGALAFSFNFNREKPFVEKPEVKAFIQHMSEQYHFNKNQLVDLFKTVKLQPKVLENMKHPLEKETWKTYQRVFIMPNYISEGASFRKKYHESLVKAEKKYGVPGSIIIATLGVETFYGSHSGGYRVLDALSNLAFTGQPRANYFKEELEQFLLLSRENHLDPAKVQGSYAGAIGAPQFMPSSYRYYAASFSNKGYVDLIHSNADAIASIGNYYKEHGWKKPDIVALRVTLKGKAYLKLRKPDGSPLAFSSSDISQYGITPDRKVPRGYTVKLLELEGQKGKEYWLAFPDFEVIKRYNPSNLYAMAVFQLSKNILTSQ